MCELKHTQTHTPAHTLFPSALSLQAGWTLSRFCLEQIKKKTIYVFKLQDALSLEGLI